MFTNDDLAFAIPNEDDFVEMVWEKNTLVMKQQKSRPGFSSGFSDFFDKSEHMNPRAVPDDERDNYGLAAAGKPSCSYINNKRSGDGTIQIVENKNLKVDQFIITHPPQQGDETLVPVNDLNNIAPMKRRKMNESNDHLVPRPDMSIAASNDIPLPPSTTNQHSDSSSSSTYLAGESQQWSDEDEESARSRLNYNRRNRNSSLSHTRSQKKRRDRINKKMRALQVLLPPNTTNKVVADKASVLDEAIDYVKSLQLQLQLMSSGAHHMFAASPMTMMPQFPMNQFSAAAATAMGLGGMAMHGFPQMSCFPYMPFFGGQSSAMPVPVVQPETTSVDQFGSNPPPPLSASNHSSYPNDFSQMGFDSDLRNYK